MNNEIEDSKILDCDLGFGNVVNNSYIDAKDKEISCEINGGIIRSGYVTSVAEISKETEVINNDADGKSKGKGKGEKFLKNAVFPDRNYEGQVGPSEDFNNMNNSIPSISINRLYKNNDQ
jgi:hypothetical protein